MPDKSQLFWLFFSFSGRVGRAAYFLAGLLLAIVQAFFLYRMLLAQEAGVADTFWANGFMATFFLGGAASSAIGAWAYAHGGWPLACGIGLAMPVAALAYFISERHG